MKKFIIIFSLSFMLNRGAPLICATGSYTNTNQEMKANLGPNTNEQPIDRENGHSIEFQELLLAIEKIDVPKIKLIINNQGPAPRLTLNKLEKDAILKKIDSLFYLHKKSAILKLFFGIPMAGIGINFFYNRFENRQKHLCILRSGSYQFSIIEDSLEEILEQIVYGNYGKMNNANYIYNLPVLILITLCTIKGSQLVIDGLKKFISDLRNLKEIKKLIQTIPYKSINLK